MSWISLVTGLILLGLSLAPLPKIAVEVEMSCTPTCGPEIFWGFDSSTYPYVEERKISVYSKVGRDRYRFFLKEIPKLIRLDPFEQTGEVRIRSLEVLSVAPPFLSLRKANATLGFGDLKLAHDLTPFQFADGWWQGSSSGRDPRIEFELAPSALKQINLIYIISMALGALLVLFGVRGVWNRFKNARGQRRHSKKLALGLPRRQFWAKVSLTAFSVGVSGVVANGIWSYFRSTKSAEVSSRWSVSLVDWRGRRIMDPVNGFAVQLDSRTSFKNFPGQNFLGLTTDSQGFRGSDSPPVGRERIVILGGSTAFGWSLTDADTLDSNLNQMIPEAHFINMATVGHTSSHHLSTMVHYGHSFRPRLYVLFAGWNDYAYLFAENLHVAPLLHKVEEVLLNHHEAHHQDQKSLLSPDPKTQETKTEEDSPTTRATEISKILQNNIFKMSEFAKATDALLLVVYQPHLLNKKVWSDSEKKQELFSKKIDKFGQFYSQGGEWLQTACAGRNVAFLNLDAHPSFQDSKDSLFLDEVHLSGQGSRLAAGLIAESVRQLLTKGTNSALKAHPTRAGSH